MKQHIINILILTFLSTGLLSAQDFLEIIKNQDYEQISQYMSNDVSIKIDKNKRVKGNKVGVNSLRTYLTNFKPSKVESSHKGSEIRGDSNYIVGKLYNAKNEGIRVFINLENGQNGKVICDLKIKAL